MKVLRVFFLGFVYGLFMKYIIDEIFVKDHLRMIADENTVLRQRIQELEVTAAQRVRSTAPPIPQEEPKPAITHQPSQRVEPTHSPAHKSVQSSNSKDDLKLIKGIGPQMEKKLNTAGVYTFAEMSRLTTSDLQRILGISKRATQNAENLLTQARKFAEEK